MPAQPDLERVGDAIRDVAVRVILPRFGALADGDVHEKGPHDPVTVADQEAEQELSRFLRATWPGDAVIGEEAVAADPDVVSVVAGLDRVWVIDPIDGTSNFVAGSEDFAVMVALVEHGRTTAAWIYQPVPGRMYAAVRGGGAWLDGRPIERPPSPGAHDELHGIVKVRYVASELRERLLARAAQLGTPAHDPLASGVQYPLLAEGWTDYVLFWRTLVWDHAPGVLLLEEAGGRASRLDGSRYEPWRGGAGLLVARGPRGPRPRPQRPRTRWHGVGPGTVDGSSEPACLAPRPGGPGPPSDPALTDAIGCGGAPGLNRS